MNYLCSCLPISDAFIVSHILINDCKCMYCTDLLLVVDSKLIDSNQIESNQIKSNIKMCA